MSDLRFLARRGALSVGDGLVTSPVFAWTWTGVSDGDYAARLSEFRPTDSQTVLEMMEGHYLLASQMIDTDGASPFAVRNAPAAWVAELNTFGWLRHFSELRDKGQRRFARTLVMDWIGRHNRFDREVWAPAVTARRVLNWLKSLDLLLADANPDQRRTITRSLATQIQSLKVRDRVLRDPFERLMSAIALTGAALCTQEETRELPLRVAALGRLLVAQIDADGLHLSRNPHIQVQLLSELVPVSRLVDARHLEDAAAIAETLERMHRALGRLILGTREVAYFNGCGQLAVDLVLSVAAQSGSRAETSGLVSGYGILCDGPGKVVADSGQVPPRDYAGHAHAGALSFEYAAGTTLVVGNCGPAPAQLPESAALFRHTSAHSAPTIDDISSARISGKGPFAGRLRARGGAPAIRLEEAENALEITTPAYRATHGLDLTRRLSLMGGGLTLVGQDRFVEAGRGARAGDYIVRFHLAPGAEAERVVDEDMIRITYGSGEAWSFLWEGGEASLAESVRHSAHFGLHRTWQIVLTGPAEPGREIAWVFTRQNG